LIGALALVWALYFFPGDPLFYWHGLTAVNRDHDPSYRYFLMGEFREGGFPSYFLWVFLFKTPLPVLALLGWASVRFARGPRAAALDEAFVLVPGLLFFTGTAAFADDMGVRYLLPAYPFLFVFASRTAPALLGGRIARAAGAAIVAATLATAVLIYPDHLAYFNELAGGPSRGHEVLDDSNVDWGQDLKRLAEYLRRENIEKVRLLYAWNGSPDYYGIPYEPVTKGDWEEEPRAGVYAISTMWLIHGMDTAARTGEPVTLADHATSLPRDGVTLALMCGTGYRSTVAASVLERTGFTNLVNLTGGMAAWQHAGLPIDRS